MIQIQKDPMDPDLCSEIDTILFARSAPNLQHLPWPYWQWHVTVPKELGIMLGSTSIIETSLESGSSLSESTVSAPRPEDTLATFLLHVVGAAIAKLHQQAFLTQVTQFGVSQNLG